MVTTEVSGVTFDIQSSECGNGYGKTTNNETAYHKWIHLFDKKENRNKNMSTKLKFNAKYYRMFFWCFHVDHLV